MIKRIRYKEFQQFVEQILIFREKIRKMGKISKFLKRLL